MQDRKSPKEKRITYEQVAKTLGVCRRTVNRLVTDDVLHPKREGHRTVSFDRAEVLKVKPLLKTERRQLIIRVAVSERSGR